MSNPQQWDQPDPNKCPDWAKESITRWVEFGVPCGQFLTACLSNDLVGAFSRADMKSMDALRHIIAFLWNEVPSGCWGSPERVRKWREKKHAQLAEVAERAQHTKGQNETQEQ